MDEHITKKYLVTFSTVKTSQGFIFNNYPVRVIAYDMEDAQQEAIDAMDCGVKN